MYRTLQTVSMVSTIVNATIALSQAVVKLTTRKHKFDIDYGINLDYKSDLSMLADAITKTVKRAYYTIRNFITKHTIVAGYTTEITLALLFIFMGYNLIYIEIFGLTFLVYRMYTHIQESNVQTTANSMLFLT